MNKISKKIVALVTMAAFVLTLVPAAAFAADASSVTVDSSSKSITLNPNTATATITLSIGDSDKAQVPAYVWLTKEDSNEIYKPESWTATASSSNDAVGTNNSDGELINALKIKADKVNAGGDITITVALKEVGTYTVHAGIAQNTGDKANRSELTPISVADAGTSTITVNDPVSAVSNQTSSFYTVDKNVSTKVNTPVDVEFDFRNSSNVPMNYVDATAGIAIWATEGDVVTDALVVKDNKVPQSTTAGVNNVYKITSADDITVEFTRSGNYTLHAAKITTNEKTVADFEANAFKSVENQNTVEVTATAQKVASITLSDAVDASDNTWTATLAKANNAESNTHTVKVLDANGVPVENKTFTVTDNSSYLNLSGSSFTTDRNGEFEFSYTASREGEYKVYITSSDTERVTLNVTVGDPVTRKAETIVANEKDITLDVAQVNDEENLLAAVTYTITDNRGNVVEDNQTAGILANEGCLSGKADSDYVKLLDKPDGFKGEATDFGLTFKDDTYTLAYTGKNLVAGDYTVRLILDNGNYADATFTVGEFDANKVKNLAVTTTSDTVEYNKVDGEANDATISYSVLAVDANGVSRDITKDAGAYALGLNPASTAVTATAGAAGTVNVEFDGNVDKEKIVGTEIQLVAASNEYGIAQTAVTIVDKGVVEGIKFDSTEGEVNKDNTVKASVVDADGNVIEGVTGKVFAYVADQSNADANVEVTPADNAKKGVADITIFSDKETTVDVVVGIQKDSATSPIYAATLTYTIGAADVNADKMVAMTIGSTDMIVNNEIVNGDAAPYVADSRTMVPIRALTETFGAKVDYKDNVVTIVDGDTTVVMNIGETTYTVNGEEQTMDVAPVIGSGDRTYVPVRFVAEALGYKVTPLYAADGTTASVVFQK
ncbi:MAG: stalk domain-containing protein [Peptococcaceae bacterium]|nr:stalk domain-containing protein [Peptococcaceae bacterium]